MERGWPNEACWWWWDGSSLQVPYRVDGRGRPRFDHRRLLLDIGSMFGEPRRLYYFGERYDVIIGARSQVYSWRSKRWSGRRSFVTVAPSRRQTQ